MAFHEILLSTPVFYVIILNPVHLLLVVGTVVDSSSISSKDLWCVLK